MSDCTDHNSVRRRLPGSVLWAAMMQWVAARRRAAKQRRLQVSLPTQDNLRRDIGLPPASVHTIDDLSAWSDIRDVEHRRLNL
jgi:hypothetical protein